MAAYAGLKGGRVAALRINLSKKTAAAQREQARTNPLPGTGGQ
jgi:hypothetical protein